MSVLEERKQRLLAPCVRDCPAGIDVPRYIGLIEQEQFSEAVAVVRERIPFPSICGRACYHPCEIKCRRGSMDSPISICLLKRAAVDFDVEEVWRQKWVATIAPDSGKKVAVNGAGPAGLSCAYQLARKGYQVTIFEAFGKPGGMLYYGIPAYRMPRDILAAEIQRIVDMEGVELKLNCAVGKDISFDDLKKEYKAVFVGIGAHKGRLLRIEGEDAPNVMSGQEFLNLVNSGQTVEIGEKVLVVGGGDTAIDAARVSKRLGAKEVTIVYRRTVKEMPAIDEEIEEAEVEGIKLEFLAAPIAFHKEGDRATGMKCIRMELGEPDDSGRRRPVPIEGSEFDIEATMVIAAISQEPDFEGMDHMREGKDWIKIDERGKTPVEDTYAGGDAVDLGIAIGAIAQGRFAAESIHEAISGEKAQAPADLPVITADKMKLSFYDQKDRAPVEQMPVAERFDSLDLEVNKTLTEEQALGEAGRCMSCGQCFLCGNCWMFCQDSAVKQPEKKGDLYEFKLENCVGCKKCAEECPCGYIEMFL